MSASSSRAHEAIRLLGIWQDGAYTIEEPLAHGPTNETWRVDHRGQSYVLRRVAAFAESLELSLERELQVVNEAARDHLTAPVVASSLTHGVVLTPYIHGRAWTTHDLVKPGNIERLAKTVRQLHALPCDARSLNMRETIERYARLASSADARQHRDLALAQLDRISARSHVVCHNDLTAPNIIDGDRLYLIDWEYAALGDPLYDLAVVVVHHKLNDQLTEGLLTNYLGQKDARAVEDLSRWCDVYEHLCELWESCVSGRRDF